MNGGHVADIHICSLMKLTQVKNRFTFIRYLNYIKYSFLFPFNLTCVLLNRSLCLSCTRGFGSPVFTVISEGWVDKSILKRVPHYTQHTPRATPLQKLPCYMPPKDIVLKPTRRRDIPSPSKRRVPEHHVRERPRHIEWRTPNGKHGGVCTI